jgi:hypothetical protein
MNFFRGKEPEKVQLRNSQQNWQNSTKLPKRSPAAVSTTASSSTTGTLFPAFSAVWNPS